MKSTLMHTHLRYVKIQNPLAVEMDAKRMQNAWKMQERNAGKILDAMGLHGTKEGKSKL